MNGNTISYYPYESFTNGAVNNDVYFLLDGNTTSATACSFVNDGLTPNIIDLFGKISSYLDPTVTTDLSSISSKGEQIFEYNLRLNILNEDINNIGVNDYNNQSGIFSVANRELAKAYWNSLTVPQKVNKFNKVIRSMYSLYGCATGNAIQLSSDAQSTTVLNMTLYSEPQSSNQNLAVGLPRGDAVLDNLNSVRDTLSTMSTNIKKMSVRKINQNIDGIYSNMSYMRELVNKIDYNTKTIREHPKEFNKTMTDIKKFLLIISLVISKTASNNDVKGIRTEIDSVNKKINYIIEKRKTEPNIMKIVVYIGAIMIFLNIMILISVSFKGSSNV